MEITVPKKTLILWQIRFGILFSVIAGAISAFSGLSLWVLIASGAIMLFGALFLFVYLPLYHKSWKIVVLDSTVSVSHGVMIKTTYILPFAKLIFAQRLSTIVSSKMELCMVALKSTRGIVLIPEIPIKEGRAILSRLADLSE